MATMNFDHAVDDCDVRPANRDALIDFRECLQRWHCWLTEDEHSIYQQITRMLWNDTVFRTVNECRGLAAENPSETVGFNGPISSFIDQSHAALQLLAIRRLTEQNRRQDAITLPRLLNDMKANVGLFTRELHVCHDGLRFDPEPAKQKHYEKVMKEYDPDQEPVFIHLPTKGPEAFGSTELAHENFDRLLGVDGSKRSRDDVLKTDIFDQLKSKLGGCSSVARVASKFIAHAADAGSRGELSDKDREITMERIAVCQRIICRVSAYIFGPMLYIGAHSLFPTPQFDPLANLDKAWADTANLDHLHQFLNRRSEKIESWIEGDWKKSLNLP